MGCDTAYSGAKLGNVVLFIERAGCDCARSDAPGDPFTTEDRRGLRRSSDIAAAVDGDGGLVVVVAGTPATATG